MMGRVFHNLKEESNLAKRLSQTNMNNNVATNIGKSLGASNKAGKVDLDQILLKRTMDAFKFYKLICK